MKEWATKQMKTELLTTRAAAFMGVALVFLVFFAAGLINGIKNEMRVHAVSTAEQAVEAQNEGWIAEVEYTEKHHLGTVTLETTSQGELTFMMGGAVGAVPGMTRTSEQDYQLWALWAEEFTALCFSKAEEIPDSGKLRMDSVIDWLTEEDRTELMKEFSDEQYDAYVFALEEDKTAMWTTLAFLAIALIGCGAAAWLLISKKAFRLTKLWKAMAKAGDPEKIREELDEPLYARMGFAISTNYICVSGSIIPREGTECVLRKDENGDDRIIFRRDSGWETEYYPDEEEGSVLFGFLKISE